MKNINYYRTSIVLTTVIVFVASIWLYYFMFVSRSAMLESTSSSRKLIVAADSARTQGREIVNLYSRTKEARAGLGNFFVPSEKAVSVIQAIESVGASSGATVSIATIKAVEPKKDDEQRIGKIIASVTASGSWKDVVKALRMFETLPYNTSIEKISLMSANFTEGKDTNVKRWQLSFDISFMTLEKPAGETATTTAKRKS